MRLDPTQRRTIERLRNRPATLASMQALGFDHDECRVLLNMNADAAMVYRLWCEGRARAHKGASC